jgi:uroporphyrinogen-III synthase
MRVVLTQSEGRLKGLEQSLQQRGYEVIRSPLIKTRPLVTPQLRAAARELLACPWLLFTSPAGVNAWSQLGAGFSANVGAVGYKTADALQQAGTNVTLTGEPQTAQGLAEKFLACDKARAPIGLPRSDRALPTLQNILEANGFETRPLTIYQTILCDFAVTDADVVILSSPSAAEALPAAVAARARLIALGPSTGNTLAEFGFAYTQASRPDAEAVIDALQCAIPKEAPCP